MSEKMKVLSLLLMFFMVSGYSYIFQPKLTVTQIAGMARDHQSELIDGSLSMEERNNEDKNIAVEEWRHERVPPETKSVRKTVKKKKTVEERRGEDGLKPEKKQKTEEKSKDEITKTKNIEEILDRNQGNEKESEERLTPETFSESIIVGEETKREGYSVAVEELDTDTEVVGERRDDRLNLVPNTKTQTNDDSRMVTTMPTDKTEKWKIVKTVEKYKEMQEEDEKFKKNSEMDQLKQTIVEEERESELVAGISLHKETRGNNEKIVTVKQEIVKEKEQIKEGESIGEKGEDIKNAIHNEFVEREKEDPIVSILTPFLRTSTVQVGKESKISATIQTITLSQNPPSSPISHQHNVHPPLSVTQVPPVSSLPPTPPAKVSPHPSVTIPSPTVSVVPVEVKPVLLLEDLLVEVLQSPGHHLKQNELEVKSSPNLEDVMVKNLMLKPAQRELQTTHKAQEINTVVQPNESKSTPKVQEATPKPKEAKFIAKDLKAEQVNPTPKSNETKFSAKLVKLTRKPNMTQPTSKPRAHKLMENAKLTKPSAKPQVTTAKTPSMQPKQNKRSKNKAVKKSKEKKRKKDNKTQKPSKKNEPVHFPYFMDNYCPPECACYGRVVQCSDKGVDKVPYGIPYNARYILLMNNHINSIQLDLLNQYVSMEFLVLSNNHLTDGAIEEAFEGVPALKRLYLDRNLLESVPTDLPVSLEELRLDNNRLSVISEAAWTQCPGLLVLSLSNNSLGNGSDSLPNAVFTRLCNLRTLNLDHNQLKSVPLGLPLSIKELYLKGNLIEQFRGGAFNGISELVVLDLSANRLTDKGLLRDSLLNATHLESLNFEGNRLKHMPRHLPHSLKTLNLEGNLITSIKKAAFSTLKNLEHLGLARNKIFKVAPGAFRTLPVLHQLDLCHNTLHQVPRQLPQSLHSVALTHNKIQSVPRDAFCWGNKSLSLSGLVRVQLEHNSIDMGRLDVHAFRCLRGFQVVHFY